MPYVDFVDINPPLIIYVSALFAGLAKLLSMHPITTFLFSVWILSIVSALSTRKILQTAFKETDSDAANILAVALSIATLWLLTSRDMEFGQREHLFMLSFFPYLATRFCRWGGLSCSRRWAVVVGLIAGIAACLKPHFLALVIGPELFWILTQRRIRPLLAPETIALSAAGLLYAAHFLLLPSEMRSAYFDRWLPMIAEGYRAWDKPLIYFFRDEILWVGPAVCATVLLLRSNSSAWYFAQTLSIVALVGLALFIGQGKGFSYHAIPAQYGLFGVAAILLAEALRGTRLSISTRRLNVALAAVLVATTVVCSALLPRTFSGAPLAAILSGSKFAQEIDRQTSPGDGVLFVSTTPSHAYPLLTQLDRRPGSRFLWFFQIPMLYKDINDTSIGFRYRNSQEQPVEERRLLTELAQDIAHKRPRLIFIHDGCAEGCTRGFSLKDYLSTIGFIDSVLVDYSPPTRLKDMLVYRRKNNPMQ